MKTYKYAVVDAPGYDGNNRTRIYSRHNSLSAARSHEREHIVHIPGNPAGQSAMIVERDGGSFSADEQYLWSDAVRGGSYTQHTWSA